MPHHLSCWQANEGCTTYGCNGLIDFIINQENATKQAAVKVDTSPAQGIAETASSNPGKFESIFETTECKLQDNVPVLIEKAALIKNSADESIFARCTFRSLTDKPIKALLLDIVASDVWGNAAEGVEGFQLLDLKTKREAEFGQTTAIPIPNKNVRSIDIVIKKILYEDRSMEDCAETYTTVPMQISLLTALGMKEAVDHFAEKTTKIAKFVPAVGKQVWRCTCGATNVAGEDICYNCKTSLIAQQSAYQPEQIIDETKALLEEKRRKEEELRLAREKEQREAEERLRKAQEEKERQEREEKEAKKAKRKKRIKRIVFAFVAVVLLAGAVYGTGWHLIPLIRYNLAASSVEKQEFDSAYNTYVALGDYKDSAEKAIETLYQKASYLEGQELFVEAATEYERIPSYQDSQTKATYCRNEANYREAKSKFDAKDYDGAIIAFTALGEYLDSNDWILKSKYAKASDLFNCGEYDKATDLFKELGSYEDSKDRMNESKYASATVLFDSKDYSKAADLFKDLGNYKDSKERVNESKYQMAEVAYADKDYQSAYKAYESVDSSYKDAKDKAKESKYLYACECLASKKYKEASDLFNNLNEYKEAKEKFKESAYAYAKECYDLKRYEDARTYFAKVKGYEDADSLWKESSYNAGLACIKSKDYKKAVTFLSDVSGYSDAKTKINEAKYGYVKANKNSTDTTTYNYLVDLKKANYSDSAAIYKELYKWKATFTAVNDSESSSTNKTSLSRYDTWVFHFKIEGGPPSGTMTPYYKITYPDGSSSGKKKFSSGSWSKGSSGTISAWYSRPAYGDTGYCYCYIYDDSGNEIGSTSIRISY
jgi:tetratricopeptide (TPR) repeat protein